MDNRRTINNFLGNRGLATLENPGAMVQQLGFLVEDDEHFKRILNKCEPRERRNCYEALRPNLRFTPRPLDVYVAELGMEAQIQQLPTVDADGKFHAFRPADIRGVQAAVEEEMSQHHLTLTCRKCTREETFHGERRAEVIFKARQAGWTYGLDPTGKGSEKASEICPDCPCLRN